MKAYEKWARQNMYDRTETEKAWRAALEWVMDTRYRDTDVPLYNLIIEELRGKENHKT